jgi:hypothetical protein
MEQTYADLYATASESFCTDDCCCNAHDDLSYVFMCMDCSGPRFCRTCLLYEHRYNPLHRIQVSTESIHVVQTAQFIIGAQWNDVPNSKSC